MNTAQDYTTTEIGNTVVRLRGDLQFSLRTYKGEACYLIEDPASSRFFRIGVPEYVLISMFDGTTTVDEAASATAGALREDAFSSEQVAQICKWLVESGLATTSASESVGRMYQDATAEKSGKTAALKNPIMIQTALGNPDRLVTVLTRVFGWLISTKLIPVWLIVSGYGFYLISSQWSEFSTAASSVLSSTNWISLVVVWVVMKLLHECGHAVACKKFGGNVNQFGIVWLLFVPMPFVDVTSSWSFDSKQKRIFVAAAGMWVEVFLAGVAAVVWSNSQPGLIHQAAANVVITGTIVTLLFNANPLMRFDGYYIFSDLTGTPNLGMHARQWLAGWARSVFLGIKPSSQDWPEGRMNLVRCYAIASFMWRMLICASLLIGAANLLEGFGLLLAVFAATLWFGVPAVKFCVFLIRGSDTVKPNRLQFISRSGLILSVLGAILIFAPAPATIRAPAIVDYESVSNVRTLTHGFVESLHVTAGQAVKEGDLLAMMKNEELEAELRELELEAEKTRHEARIFHQQDDLVAWQIAQDSLLSQGTRIAELNELVNGLALRAPISGNVVSGCRDSLKGSYLQKGDVVCRIASNDRKVVNAMVAQQDLKSVRSDLKSDVSINVWGFARGINGEIVRIDPRATNELTHPALAAPAGGPLAVISSRDGKSDEDAQEQWKLLEPRVNIQCEVQSRLVNRMRVGQLAEVQLKLRDESLGSYLWASFNTWLSGKLKINHGV